MRLPDFLCIGAAKAGSTTLHEQLSLHPRLWLPDAKELHFFDNDENFDKGPSHYASYFAKAPDGRLLGEITPAYMSYSSAAARIFETLGPDTRLIVSLREPVARAYSEYLHNHRRGFIDCDFETAIGLESEVSSATEWERRKVSFISRGLYHAQISRFLEVFPRENLLFVVMEEDLFECLPATLNRIYAFLGVAAHEPVARTVFNKSYQPRSMFVQRMLFGDFPGRRLLRALLPSQKFRKQVRRTLAGANAQRSAPAPLSDETKQRLQEMYFADDMKKLEELIGRDLSCWQAAEGRA
jgi:hypothetical protein